MFIEGVSCYENSVNIGVKQWPTTQIHWLPNILNYTQKITCSTEGCLYQPTRADNMAVHEETCTVETTVTAEQQPHGKPSNMIDDLIEAGILSEELRSFSIDHFCVYDIEVVQKSIGGEERLVPISIAVSSTFTEDRYFERKSSSPEDGDEMISNFMDYLVEINTLYREQ